MINCFSTKEPKQFNGRKDYLSINGGTTGCPYAKEENKELNLGLPLYITINTKWTTDLNVSHKILKQLGKKTENTDDLHRRRETLQRPSKA